MTFYKRKSNLAGVGRWPLFIVWMLVIGGAFAAIAAATPIRSPRPPTVDPTFGLPLPEAHAHPLGKPPAWIWASTVG
ncbi:MAG: hypothetical protein ACP5I8_13395, partial [Phycisphaerae bacterium]